MSIYEHISLNNFAPPVINVVEKFKHIRRNVNILKREHINVKKREHISKPFFEYITLRVGITLDIVIYRISYIVKSIYTL
jgi:hypothetical protein